MRGHVRPGECGQTSRGGCVLREDMTVRAGECGQTSRGGWSCVHEDVKGLASVGRQAVVGVSCVRTFVLLLYKLFRIIIYC